MEASKELDYGFTFDEIDDLDSIYKNEEKYTKDDICTECENEYRCINCG